MHLRSLLRVGFRSRARSLGWLALGLVPAATIQAQTLISYYSFNSDTLTTSGTGTYGTLVTAASSGLNNNSNLTAINSDYPTVVSGQFGTGLQFGPIVDGDGTSVGRLQTSNFAGVNTALGTSFSISFWMKTSDVTATTNSYVLQIGDSGPSQNAVIFGYNPGTVEIYAPTSSSPTSADPGGDMRTASQLTLSSSLDNTWINVTYTYNGTDLIGYVNGTAQFDRQVNVSLDSTGGLSIGGSQSLNPGEESFFAGSLDDVAIFDGTLSSAQVGALQTEAADQLAAVPEPSTYAAIMGACALGFAWLRRRAALPA